MKLLAKWCYFAQKKILSSGSNSGPLSLGPLIFGSSLEECDTAWVAPIHQRSPRNFKWLFDLKLNWIELKWNDSLGSICWNLLGGTYVYRNHISNFPPQE